MKLTYLSLSLRLLFVLSKALLLLCFMLSCNTVFGQDIITRTDSVRIEADILKVDKVNIYFKLHANPAGLEYIISTIDVLSIDYANGKRQTFAPAPVQLWKVDAAKYGAAYQGRNFIRYSLSDLLFYQVITLSYERILASDKVGIKIPFSFGLNPEREEYEHYYHDYQRRDIIFHAGLALTYYPFGQGRFIFYLGPQIDVAKFRYSEFYNYPPVKYANTSVFYSCNLNNGVSYHFTKKLIVGLDVGVGARFLNYERLQYNLNIDRGFLSGHLQVGYRF